MNILQTAYSVAVAIWASTSLFVPLASAQGNLLPLPEAKPIRGMNTPAISPDGKLVCFSWQGDLWTIPSTGGMASRLTVHEAHDVNPHFSPDGKWIAFASNREGNYDVYVIPATGGTARQLTYHSINEYPQDWSPDGSKILFYSQRGTEGWQLYTIDVNTQVVKTVTSDNMQIRYASFAPDGKSIAYDRCGTISTWWRPLYKGSANYDIYTKNLASGKLTRITDYEGQDLWPMYSGDGSKIFYVSDRLTSGTPNIVSSSATGGKPSLLTKHTSDGVRWPSISRDGSSIVYVLNGDLYTVKANGGQPTKLAITALSDDKINNIQRLNLTNGATEIEISPDGKTLAFVNRGEIWTIPVAGGNATRLTRNPARDYDIYWTKDNKSLIFASDRNGNFDLYTIDVTTKVEKQLTTSPDDENNPKLSPDGKSIAFLRSGKTGGLYVMPTDGSSAPKRLVEANGNNLEFGYGINSFSWSPDNKWLSFSRRDTVQSADVWVVPVAGGKATNITYTPGTNVEPEWTSDGKYLAFVSMRGGIPNVYAIPLVPEKSEPDPTAKPDDKKSSDVKIDFDDIENRAKQVTTTGATAFMVSPDGKYIIYVAAVGGGPDYYMIPIGGGAPQRMTATGDVTSAPRFTSDLNTFYTLGPGGTLRVVRRTGPVWTPAPVPFEARMDFDRKAEVRQAFNEFWRRLNTGFYDPNMHGVDWRGMRTKYEPLLEGIGTKEEFAFYFLSPLVGELNGSHTEISPAGGVTGSLTPELGISFDEDYTGPGLKVKGYMPKGPDDDLGPRIKPGEFVLAIDGEDVQWNEHYYQLIADKAGKTVELLVNSKASKDGAKIVKIKPVSSTEYRTLEYERRVKEAKDLVDKLSEGRLAYIHIKGMDQPSLQRLEKELWGKVREKDALVIDIRNNGGGNTHDAILGQISRPVYGYEQPRDGLKMTQPVRTWDKPIILLINQNSASDAEIFPNGFRNLKLGKIVGMPTPGYVIGTFDQQLQDGTGYRIPMFGWFNADGKDMENNGVKPDITVEMTPEDIADHNDRQLKVAIETLLKGLPKRK